MKSLEKSHKIGKENIFLKFRMISKLILKANVKNVCEFLNIPLECVISGFAGVFNNILIQICLPL